MSVALNTAPLLAPDDDETIAPALLRRVVQSLTRADVMLLEKLERVRRIDSENVQLDAQAILWLAHFGLVGVEVDTADRVYLVWREEEGKAALDERLGRPSQGGKNDHGRGGGGRRCEVGAR